MTGCAIVQFPEMISSLYESIKRRWGTQKTSVANKLDERKIGRWSIQGYKDIQRLNQLIYDKRGTTDEKPAMSTSMKESMDCLIAANNTLIEIVSRNIGRTDKFESKLHQITSKNHDVNDTEEATMQHI